MGRPMRPPFPTRLPIPSPFRPALLLMLLHAWASPLLAGVLGDDLNEEESADYVSLPKLRLAVDAGLSQWLISDDSTYTKAGKGYEDDLQSGRDVSVDAVYYFMPRGGAGLTWIWFLSRTSSQDLVLRTGEAPRDLEERLSMYYIGPSFWTRVRAGRYGLLHAGFGAGYLHMLDTWTDDGEAVRVEAKSYALVTSVGWDYSFMRHLGLGLNGRFVFSTVKEWTYNGERVRVEDPVDVNHWINMPLYRLELNAGVRFFL